MIRAAAAAAALLLGGAGHSSDAGNAAGASVAADSGVQVVIRQQVIIRVPRKATRVQADASPAAWRETDGPRCIDARQIAAASPGRASVDMRMRDDRHLRAVLDRHCAGLGFYRSFYISPDERGRICAERDSFRSRMGGACRIVAFRTLRPPRP